MSWRAAGKWAQRYWADGEAGMQDRSSQPLRQPNRTLAAIVRKTLHLRRKRRWGSGPIGDQLGLTAYRQQCRHAGRTPEGRRPGRFVGADGYEWPCLNRGYHAAG